VRYPDSQVVTANELHIPVGQRVDVKVTSADVIHSFWVPSLQAKMDLIPGRVNTTWIEADQAGEFRGQCAEYCGVQHAHMALIVVAEPPAQYQAWLAAQKQPAANPTDPEAQQGLQTFAQAGCINCHTIRLAGAGPGGTIGPDLTHVASRKTIAAGTLPNGRGQRAGWVMDAQAIKPGNKMPTMDLDPASLQAILALLDQLQ